MLRRERIVTDSDKQCKARGGVCTDNWLGYKGLNKQRYNHISVSYNLGEYVKEQAHTIRYREFLIYDEVWI